MKQLLQNFRTGNTELADLPCPQLKPGHVLIHSQTSLISLGTERMLVSFGKANYLQKAQQQPEKVRQVIAKAKTDGLFPTLDAIRAKLDVPIPLGYCNAGVVIAVGAGIHDLKPGDRVVSNGPHAEVVRVPRNLCCAIPPGVQFEEACFTVAASIALHGIRLAEPTLGERFVVTGLGLIGLLAIQILRAHGCHVLGLDFDSKKVALANALGADGIDLSNGADAESAVLAFTRQRGADAVIITASTQSSSPVNQAAQLCRKRGRIVQVGATGLELERDALYKKELTFRVSCSYGPGRYDSEYEESGHDYPVAYVRWTEQRNFEAILDLFQKGQLNVQPLISHRFEIDNAASAYELVLNSPEAVAILLKYPEYREEAVPGLLKQSVFVGDNPQRKGSSANASSRTNSNVAVSVIGAGNFTSRFILPVLANLDVTLDTIVASAGVSSAHEGRKHHFARLATDPQDAISSSADLIFITTKHDTHARFVIEALKAGKAVFVEKPLCINEEQLRSIEEVYAQCEAPFLMVGYNRRFSPLTRKMKALLDTVREPKTFILTVNAGALPKDHWHTRPEIGGGRVLSEACHFIDLLRYLVGAPIKRVQAMQVEAAPGLPSLDDNISITLQFEDGSHGTVHYFSNGSKDFPKERIEAFAAGRILQLDNFRELQGYGWPGFRRERLFRQDKGHSKELESIVECVRNGQPSPISFGELNEVMHACFLALASARK